MDAVKVFNQELSSLYEIKPPISKAKMTSITKSAIKAIKFYKHVVQSVEKFIQKCRPEYKIPGLYVIDSIVRQSRHQFGPDKDVFAPRFAKNVQYTFHHLYKCNEDEKSRVIRVLNLWQKNEVFASELIQPLFDLANPNSEIAQQMDQAAPAPPPALGPPSGSGHTGPSGGPNATNSGSGPVGPGALKDSTAVLAGLASGALPGTSPVDQQVTQQLQTILQLLKNHVQPQEQQSQPGTVQFNKQLLDFDYSDDEEGGGAHDSHDHPPPPQMLEALQSILGNGALLEKLKSIGAIGESQIHQLRQLLPQVQQQQQHQPTHLMGAFSGDAGSLASGGGGGSTVPESSSSLQPALWSQDKFGMSLSSNHHRNNISHHGSGRSPPEEGERDETDEDIQIVEDRTTSNWRRNANVLRRSRSRSRDRKRSRRSRSRSRDRANNGLCSTTLWVGHLSKLVAEDELSDLFGEFGDVETINLIPPRGCAFVCMNRRMDAYKALKTLHKHKLQGKPITLAWAPGKGMKDKQWKDFWDVDMGVSYIPIDKLDPQVDMVSLEAGGTFDEDTMPDWMKTMRGVASAPQAFTSHGAPAPSTPHFIPMPEGLTPNQILQTPVSGVSEAIGLAVAAASAPPPGMHPNFGLGQPPPPPHHATLPSLLGAPGILPPPPPNGPSATSLLGPGPANLLLGAPLGGQPPVNAPPPGFSAFDTTQPPPGLRLAFPPPVSSGLIPGMPPPLNVPTSGDLIPGQGGLPPRLSLGNDSGQDGTRELKRDRSSRWGGGAGPDEDEMLGPRDGPPRHNDIASRLRNLAERGPNDMIEPPHEWNRGPPQGDHPPRFDGPPPVFADRPPMNNFMGRDNDNFIGGGRGSPFRHEGPNMFPRGGRGNRPWRGRGGNPRFPSFGRNGDSWSNDGPPNFRGSMPRGDMHDMPWENAPFGPSGTPRGRGGPGFPGRGMGPRMPMGIHNGPPPHGFGDANGEVDIEPIVKPQRERRERKSRWGQAEPSPKADLDQNAREGGSQSMDSNNVSQDASISQIKEAKCANPSSVNEHSNCPRLGEDHMDMESPRDSGSVSLDTNLENRHSQHYGSGVNPNESEDQLHETDNRRSNSNEMGGDSQDMMVDNVHTVQGDPTPAPVSTGTSVNSMIDPDSLQEPSVTQTDGSSNLEGGFDQGSTGQTSATDSVDLRVPHNPNVVEHDEAAVSEPWRTESDRECTTFALREEHKKTQSELNPNEAVEQQNNAIGEMEPPKSVGNEENQTGEPGSSV
ncbi:hypothetical protein TCAL_09590 [Tigriopus californicus]|uniref:CID domain-containing protein n=1 Tax=Tigriopus californicus TaxID=6832 RepID=A0A553PEY7_TIGCA|nr:hypothetical protein TCAL_09590 [Tigriopus californicus]